MICSGGDVVLRGRRLLALLQRDGLDLAPAPQSRTHGRESLERRSGPVQALDRQHPQGLRCGARRRQRGRGQEMSGCQRYDVASPEAPRACVRSDRNQKTSSMVDGPLEVVIEDLRDDCEFGQFGARLHHSWVASGRY